MKYIHFYKNRKIYFSISIAIILIGLVFALINGVALDISFQGGTMLRYNYTGSVDPDKAASIVQGLLNRKADAQLQTSLASDKKTLTINLADKESISSSQQKDVSSKLVETFPDSNISLQNSQTVQPSIGARFFRNGMLAIGLSFLLILIYVGFRFSKIGGFSAGAMAIVALFHDAFVVTAVFIIFRIPLNDSFIAAILTIIGFSINDTIVIYDRIRENKGIMGKKTTTEELVDTSISQSMTRSINTNIAVFVSITIVYIFAQIYRIDSIKSFALPMMFGTISGCYSTICIAGPLWTMWKNRKLKAKA